MEKLTDFGYINYLAKKYNFRLKKKYGQNFLLNEHILRQIVAGAEITKEDVVVEIGPGFGTLTREISKSAKEVLCIEIDRGVKPVLEETLKDFDNVRVIFNDVMKIDLDKVVQEYCPGTESYKVVANLPYYITTPIVMKLLEEEMNIFSITVMVQKEVAERMYADPGGKDYGALSVSVQYHTEPELVTHVGKKNFFPAPEVDSAVICLKLRSEPPVSVEDEKMFFQTVKGAFGQRRKTLLNSLSNNLGFIPKDELVKVLEKAGIDSKRRGETLSLDEFAKIANYLTDYKKGLTL